MHENVQAHSHLGKYVKQCCNTIRNQQTNHCVSLCNCWSFPGGLALPSKTPNTPDSSPDISRFQPSPTYTFEVNESYIYPNIYLNQLCECKFRIKRCTVSSRPSRCRCFCPAAPSVRRATVWCMMKRSWQAGRQMTPTSTALARSAAQPSCLSSMWKSKT